MLLLVGALTGCPVEIDVDNDGFSPEPFDVDDPVDCNDDAPLINPGVADICDGIDNDCDGAIDEGLDEDGDGFFEISPALCASGTDCDDTSADINPDADELCDSVDHDCDGDLTNGLTETPYYPDLDGDGFGAGDAEPNCDDAPPENYSDNDLDCVDNDDLVNPDATEICNAVDDDCDGETDAEFDTDGDGFTTCGADGQVGTGDDDDCNDGDATVNPDATEVCNGVDDDCDGVGDVDDDLDGFLTCDDDCDDTDAAINPAATEICDGIDNDCDETNDLDLDGDGDLYLDCAGFVDIGIGLLDGDCDDADAAVNPAATEICDGIDNDCDTVLFVGEEDVDGDGFLLCDDDCNDNDGDINPGATELACDGVDSDCTADLAEVDEDADGYLACAGFVDAGLSLLGGDDCGPTEDFRYPGAPELCNDLDDDCDGAVEVGTDDVDGDGQSICDGDCDDGNAAINSSASEICDGLDTDCEGTVPADESDADADGWIECAPYTDFGALVDGGGDCDDGDADFSPAASEVCDGLDNDCDTVVPADEQDGDLDGYVACDPWIGTLVSVIDGNDCEDGDIAVNPGATELCDGADEDCDGFIDEDFDTDADDFTTCGVDGIVGTIDDDCDDTNPIVYPEAPEICDLIDNSCTGDIDDADSEFLGSDVDLDGYDSELCGGFDCDDNDPAIIPVDDDGDGFTPCSGDCDETDPYVHENATEACDGVDTDCDGGIDEADVDGVNPDWDGDGVTAEGCNVNGTDCDDRDAHVFPETDTYTSGVQPQCAPVIYPGFTFADQSAVSTVDAEWHAGRISLPDYFVDPVSTNHFIYFRGHHTDTLQSVGVVESSDDGATWSDPVGPLLGPNPGEWDHRNVSQPSVAYLSGGSFARRYVMAYHARQETGGTREVGIATASDPMGPWDRLEPGDGTTAITAPTLPAAASGLDDDRTLHPHLYYDDTSDVLHVWYSGRSTTDPGPKPLRVFHGTSTDGGMTWTRTGDVVMDSADSAWLSDPLVGANQISQVSVIEDPTNTTTFEIWFTGGLSGEGLGVGTGTGTATDWDSPNSFPALENASDCRRFDGEVITGRGIRHDPSTDTYHWYYGGQTDLNTSNCADNEDLVFENGGDTASYVAYGINEAPLPTIDAIPAPATTQDITGTITDTGADQVIVTVSSDKDGFLGTADVAAVIGSPPNIQTTTWGLLGTALSSDDHILTVEAVDEAGTVRTVTLGITVP